MSSENPIHYYRFSSGGWEIQDTPVIEEANVSLTVNGELWLNFTCTPTHLEEMCVGFLFNEGFLQSASEVEAITVCADRTNVDVWLDHSVRKPERWRRTSGCTGGVTTVEPELGSKVALYGAFSTRQVVEGMNQLLQSQSLYRETRGIHCSTLFNGNVIQYLAEDIGRHNTLDKLSGMYLMKPKEIFPVMVFTTGRVSSEMLQKSARLGAIAVISRTSPTSYSIKRAKELGVTMVGYARRDQFIVYSHPERLIGFNEAVDESVFRQLDDLSSSISA